MHRVLEAGELSLLTMRLQLSELIQSKSFVMLAMFGQIHPDLSTLYVIHSNDMFTIVMCNTFRNMREVPTHLNIDSRMQFSAFA